MNRIFTLFAIVLFSGLCQAQLAIGDSAPFRLGKNANSGEEVIIQDYAGKITVVMFWATWCDYCYKTLPAMEALQEQLGSSNVQVISVAVKDESRAVNKITSEMKELSMISSVDKTGKVAESFGDEYMPNVWVVNRTGKISGHMAVKDDNDLIKILKMIESAVKAK
jgi:thiol-disulfide isomerase/thioredoxin